MTKTLKGLIANNAVGNEQLAYHYRDGYILLIIVTPKNTWYANIRVKVNLFSSNYSRNNTT